jgi:hypothetical protein
MPCTLERAFVEVTPTRRIVKLTFSELDFTTGDLLVDVDVTIDARDAHIRRTSGDGPVIAIGAGKVVTLLGGEITGGAGGTGDGITCTSGTLTIDGTDIGGNAASGINDTGCATVVERAVIHDNTIFGVLKNTGTLALARSIVRSNSGGGVILTSNGTTFAIVGNMFWTNGQGAAIGGIFLQTDSTTSRLEFNSFNANLTNGTNGAAIHCQIAGFTARNNVMFENGTGEQVSGSCGHAFSLISPGAVIAGSGNFAANPLFFNAVAGDLHTSPGSPTEGRADPTSTLADADDLDGESRTSPADVGADEHP